MQLKPTGMAALLLGAFACSSSREGVAGPCGPPLPGWSVEADAHAAVVNRIALDHNGALIWNGVWAGAERVRLYLRQTSGLVPRPSIHLEYEQSANCADVRRIRSLIESNYHCADGSCVASITS